MANKKREVSPPALHGAGLVLHNGQWCAFKLQPGAKFPAEVLRITPLGKHRSRAAAIRALRDAIDPVTGQLREAPASTQ